MSDDLIGDEFANRPDDDDLAFVYYERIFRKILDKELATIEANSSDTYNDSYNHFMQTYINNVLATLKALNLPLLGYWLENPAVANDDKNFRQIKFDIDAAI